MHDSYYIATLVIFTVMCKKFIIIVRVNIPTKMFCQSFPILYFTFYILVTQ